MQDRLSRVSHFSAGSGVRKDSFLVKIPSVGAKGIFILRRATQQSAFLARTSMSQKEVRPCQRNDKGGLIFFRS